MFVTRSVMLLTIKFHIKLVRDAVPVLVSL